MTSAEAHLAWCGGVMQVNGSFTLRNGHPAYTIRTARDAEVPHRMAEALVPVMGHRHVVVTVATRSGDAAQLTLMGDDLHRAMLRLRPWLTKARLEQYETLCQTHKRNSYA